MKLRSHIAAAVSALLVAVVLVGCSSAPRKKVVVPAQPAAPKMSPLMEHLGDPVDAIVVEKSKHRMYLYKKGHVYRIYRVSLGKVKGRKLSAGDKRTPEGRYTIDGRRVDSDYYKALHISYPSAEDRQRAAAVGLKPGNNIVIHGAPNGMEDANILLRGLDWTGGCIAVTNLEMEEIWRLVRDGTPIDIRP